MEQARYGKHFTVHPWKVTEERFSPAGPQAATFSAQTSPSREEA